ncbi:hypothetical protein PYW08_009939 [Mythimna loreyi]|uniref:Uncharacterized protein n=1 Tax=Mythimna loreyi TaxID=667449 RepID=A0ACC2Q4X8_9NEOP|nr:hypothetical protein PYW08_009939 [Mythimna loreyi]
MSLLEDIFLQDEADEAQELERVIEGDEFDERPRSRSRSPDNSDDNEPKDDEAEEDKRRVDPSSTKSKRVTKNPRFILNPARLTGPRGIQVLPDHFKDFKFKGKGHEKEDLDMVLKKLEHWAYRLYPKFQFEDCLKKIETLGKKRPVMVHLQKIRTDQFMSEDIVNQKDSSDEETQPAQEPDEFDKLLQQQIDLARATPAPGSVKKVMATPKKDRSPFTLPKATSSPSISDEQKERMIRNRKLAEERRLARLKQNSVDNGKQDNVIIEVDEEVETNVAAKKVNRSNVIDSSDDECDVTSVNQSISVDIHNGTEKDKERNEIHEVEEAGETLDDIVMEDKNDAQEINQDLVEIIDVNDKDVHRNVRAIEQRDSAEIIEINDQAETNKETNHLTKNLGEIIEIHDQTDRIIERNHLTKVLDGVIEIDDESHQGSTEVTANNDPNDKGGDDIVEIIDDVTCKDRVNNVIEVVNENVIVDEIISNTPEVEISNNDTENQSKKNENNDSILSDKVEENRDDAKDSDLNYRSKDVSNLENDSKMAEVIEDVMDVDFSDDF